MKPSAPPIKNSSSGSKPTLPLSNSNSPSSDPPSRRAPRPNRPRNPHEHFRIHSASPPARSPSPGRQAAAQPRRTRTAFDRAGQAVRRVERILGYRGSRDRSPGAAQRAALSAAPGHRAGETDDRAPRNPRAADRVQGGG